MYSVHLLLHYTCLSTLSDVYFLMYTFLCTRLNVHNHTFASVVVHLSTRDYKYIRPLKDDIYLVCLKSRRNIEELVSLFHFGFY